MKDFRRREGERGASLVEFAILAPLLVLLLFGIMDFSWAFAQTLNIRHGAREGARLAAVDFGPGNLALVAETCGRMDLISDAVITIAAADLDTPSDGIGVNDEVTVSVTAPTQSITSLFATWLPSNLSSTVSIRIEQPPSWSPGSLPCP